MSSLLPDGFTLREVKSADLAAVVDLLNDFDAAFGTLEQTTEADLRSSWHDLGEAGRAWLVERGETPAAYFEVFPRGTGAMLDGYVRPEYFGRGLGRAVVELAERRASELGSNSLTAGTLAVDERATNLFTSAGWEHERVFLRMAIDLHGDESTPQTPGGFAVRTLQPGDEHALHRAIQDAFAENWNFQPRTFDEFRVQVLERDEFDSGLCWLVKHGREVAGAIRCTRRRFEMGWIDSLAVRPAWRRRGLGELLLRTAFAEFARRGEERVGLGVDAQSETGATRLYERVGMQVVFRANVFRKQFR